MYTIVKQLSECSVQDLDAFEALVKAGGKVKPGLRKRIEHNAERLAFHYAEDGQVVAVAALKRPNLAYKKRIFQKAKTDENPDEYLFELGWIAVAPHAQGKGLSRVIVEAILPSAKGKNVYATTEVANEKMRKTITRFAFAESGCPYLDDEGEDRLLLYVLRSP